MPLVRCSSQMRQTIEEFYSELASSDDMISTKIGKSMLSIIALINQTFLQTKIYGLTSHYYLLLLSQDNDRTDRYVTIIATGYKEIHVEYLIPDPKRPWEDAIVKGTAMSIDEFKKYLIIAMTESLGWQESSELNELYLKTKE